MTDDPSPPAGSPPKRPSPAGWADLVFAFGQAAEATSTLLRSPAVAARWREPSALEGMTVGGITAHVHGALRRLDLALDEELPRTPVPVGIPEFFGANRIDGDEDRQGLHALIRQDAEHRAERGHVAVTQRFDELVQRLTSRLAGASATTMVPVLQVRDGVTSLADYVRTRVVELVVHADDISASVGMAPSFPPEPLSVAAGTLFELARARVGDLAVVRAMARSERDQPGTLRVL